MSFLPARPDDATDLVGLRDDLARWLTSRGIRQWRPGEFALDRMRTWVDRSWVHVHRVDGAVAAAVAVLPDDPDIWQAPPDGDAGYIHLLMVARPYAGQGLGDAALAHAEEVIRRTGRPLARLDAVTANPALGRWYTQRGYRPVGVRSFDDPALFATTLFEKGSVRGATALITPTDR